MISHLRRLTVPDGPDHAGIRAAAIAADPACGDTLNAAALAELNQRRTVARKHTICGHLFPTDEHGLLRRTARNHGMTVAELRALDRDQG